MASDELGESSAVVRQRVVDARAVSKIRFADCLWKLNSQIPPSELRKRFRAEKLGMNFLHTELDNERLSARGFHKVLRIAWSIADSNGHSIPSRDDVESTFLPLYLDLELLPFNPFESLDQDGVGLLVKTAADQARKLRPDFKLGVCGEHGGDGRSIQFFNEVGLDYVSCSPFRVPVARLEAGRAMVLKSASFVDSL